MVTAIIIFLMIIFLINNKLKMEDIENEEINAEIRHRELMDSLEQKEKARKKSRSVNKASRIRRVTDSSGNILYEEVIVQGDYDDFDDEDDDYYD
ncbi:MAG: hypothetical protein K5866_10970 [Treponema sp.]|nr:hypothetical protein [Treponema sp.]